MLQDFCKKKETYKFRILKCDGERNQKNSHFRKTFNYTSEFRKNNTEAFDRTDKTFVAPLRMHF